jgi:aminoglycoside 3-N-acetyltransferase
VTVTGTDIFDAISRLGLAGRPVCVHSSLSSFGHVDGGPGSVIDAILHAGCTLLVPTFSSAFDVQPPVSQRLPRNGIDYDDGLRARPTLEAVYSPGCKEIDGYMGAVPKAVISMGGHVRGRNPLNSFSAVGPLARDLIAPQSRMDVYAPLRRLSELGGAFLLMGVRLTSMTALHLAEEMAGRTLFRRWARDRHGGLVQVAVGSCSSGFHRLDGVLAGIERRTVVGNSRWRLFPAAPMLELASKAVREDPTITDCGRPSCTRCLDAIAGGPVLP